MEVFQRIIQVLTGWLYIYTLGHRNPQGLAFTPNGKLLQSEKAQTLTMKLTSLSKVAIMVGRM